MFIIIRDKMLTHLRLYFIFICIGFIVIPTCLYSETENVEVNELWTGSLYTSSYRVGICFSSTGSIRGVLNLRLANGQVDVYHFYGTVNNNKVFASHSSGHIFNGELIGNEIVKGEIQLKNGFKVNLEGKRVQDVELIKEDCAPLPENR